MNSEQVEYKGYTIVPLPSKGSGDEVWFGGYRISKDGATIRTRENISPGFFYFDAARNESIEYAKIEIDHLPP